VSKRHHRGCQGGTLNTSCLSAKTRARHRCVPLQIYVADAESHDYQSTRRCSASYQFSGLPASNSAFTYRTYWMIAMAETVHNETRISEPELTRRTSYEQEQLRNILARCYSRSPPAAARTNNKEHGWTCGLCAPQFRGSSTSQTLKQPYHTP